MKSKEYIDLARRTINKDMSNDDYLLMLTLGIVGESNELYGELIKANNRDTVIKECGDLYWYLYNFMIWIDGYEESNQIDPFYLLLDKEYLNNPEFKEHFRNTRTSPALCSHISRTAAVISEIVKKYKFHYHKLDYDQIFLLLDSIDMNIRMILINQGISRDEVLEANVEKLRKRYPDGFKSTDSIERKE